jgi:hypothetical protein
MRKLLILVGVLLAICTPLIALGAPAVAKLNVNRQLADVRKATAKYHDVNVALADGYVPAPVCAAHPTEGGMGFHYIKPSLAGDLESNELQPELLLYAPTAAGLKLVGVEYFQADAGQGRPSLFGQGFNGPMPGHEPGMPVHYDLHVWLWEHNPAGMFAEWNVNVTC